MMEPGIKILMVGTGCSQEVAEQVSSVLSKACAEFEINTSHRMAAFLANIGVESAGLARLEENLNYSAERLAAVWPFRFAEFPHAAHPVPNSLARQLGHKPQLIAESVYGGRFGNDTAGDGWAYRGSGYLACTFKSNFEKTGERIGVDLVGKPDLLRSAPIAAKAAAAQFDDMGCNILADSGNIAHVIHAINGKEPCAANQGDLRIARYKAVLPLLVEAEPVVVSKK